MKKYFVEKRFASLAKKIGIISFLPSKSFIDGVKNFVDSGTINIADKKFNSKAFVEPFSKNGCTKDVQEEMSYTR